MFENGSTIHLDLETYSSVDLTKSGLYRYCESHDFEILLLSYAFDSGDIQTVDLAGGEKVPQRVIDAVLDENVLVWAYNSSFERVCLSRYLSEMGVCLDPFADNHHSVAVLGKAKYLNPKSWRCTMVWSAYMGLPLSLEGAGAVLKLDKQKLTEGKDLIKFFCQPCAPTKSNGHRIRNYPYHAPDKWSAFKKYNVRDIETEMSIQEKLVKFPVPENIWDEYHLDQEINDRGVALDREYVRQAIEADKRSRSELIRLMRELTELENPNSVAQMKQWLADNGLETDTLGKKAVAEMLKTAPKQLGEVLTLRQQLAKSSIKKYQAMENAVCTDGRARGMFKFYGANRTGRFSGRLIQLQNLPQNHMGDLHQARSLLKSGNFEALTMLYDSVPEVLSELIRTAFVPKPGFKFIVADFSSIEAMVVAWLAGEKWKMDVFAGDGKIYEATAARMFNVPIESVTKGSLLRQKAKQTELACIAEGELVLTNKGLVPIEKVTVEHKVWDGENFVNHEGTIYQGIKEVINYGGLTATEDHHVWIQGKAKPVRLGEAAASGASLVHTGNGREAVRLGENYKSREAVDKNVEPLLGSDPMYKLRKNPRNDESRNHNRRKPCSTEQTEELENHRRKARLYDILNAGPNHRFTVSNCLVHNCGYGGSVGALKAMGALDMGIAEDELKPLVNAWRSANPTIVRLWWDVDRAAKTAVKERTSAETHGIRFSYQSGFLFITLPSGRRLCYVKPRIENNRFGGESVTYEGIGATKQWERIESFGAKFVENAVQAISRDILCHVMRRLDSAGLCIVMHVHDEVVIEAPPDVSPEDVCRLMSETPLWAKGLPLRADGFECDYYQKD